MRRKYKLMLIIIISIIIAYFIYFFNKENKIYLVSLGDGVSSGETSYNIDGISYNDYVKEYLDSKKKLKNYNFDYSKKNYTIKELIFDIDNNIKVNNLHIKQIIHKGNVITIHVGEDELTHLGMTNDIDKDTIEKFIKNYDHLLSKIKNITEAKILVLGLYENDYLNKTDVIILNSEIANLCKKYNYTFINISDLLLDNKYFLNKNSYYFSYKAHELLSEIIIHSF